MQATLTTLLQIFGKMPFYAVARGRCVGVYLTWPECQAQVYGFNRPIFRKFNMKRDAENFIVANGAPLPVDSYDTDEDDLEMFGSDSDSSTSLSNDPVIEKSVNIPIINGKKIDAAQARIKALQKQIRELSNPATSSNTAKRSATTITETTPNKTRKLNSASTSKTSPIVKMQKHGEYSFLEDADGYVHVYTDGSCEDNGRSNARAGLGVYFAEGHALNTSRPVSGRATNNCGEIQASTEAIKLAEENGIKNLCINTDSKFLINSMTNWIDGWKARGWKLSDGKPVKNETDFKELDNLIQDSKMNVKWNHVKAHSGILGNERADALAKEGGKMYQQFRST